MDIKTPAERSANMAKIRSKNSKPEVIVRSMLHRLGYRFRVHKADLPGKPDIVLKKWKTVIFIHGCFWHRHKGCPRASIPKSRLEYWIPKLEGNENRDRQQIIELQKMGWRVLVIWECAVNRNKLEELSAKLKEWLSSDSVFGEIGRDDVNSVRAHATIH